MVCLGNLHLRREEAESGLLKFILYLKLLQYISISENKQYAVRFEDVHSRTTRAVSLASKFYLCLDAVFLLPGFPRMKYLLW